MKTLLLFAALLCTILLTAKHSGSDKPLSRDEVSNKMFTYQSALLVNPSSDEGSISLVLDTIDKNDLDEAACRVLFNQSVFEGRAHHLEKAELDSLFGPDGARRYEWEMSHSPDSGLYVIRVPAAAAIAMQQEAVAMVEVYFAEKERLFGLTTHVLYIVDLRGRHAFFLVINPLHVNPADSQARI